MNEFIALRARARDKRDKAVAEARKEYEATLVQIAALEQDLLGKVSTRYKKISTAIEAVIPSDSTFTTVDILAGLEALDSGRAWRKRSIDNHLSRMRERGLVRRLQRASIHEPAVYARVGVQVKPQPFGDQTLPMVVRQVLEARQPLRATELVVAMLEAGYQTTMNPKALRDAVSVVLREGEFVKRGDKWEAGLGTKNTTAGMPPLTVAPDLAVLTVDG